MAARIPKELKGRRLNSVVYEDGTICVLDCVLINPDSSDTNIPYVGKIIQIIKPDNAEDVQLYVNWFYRPEEAYGGRKTFHGEKELFLSDHFDWCSLKTVMTKCRVLSLPKYQELKKIEDADFYARFTYRPAEKLFEPDRVPVFCRCEMPYNPDQFMVCCDTCTEWYHPECLKLSNKAIQAVDNWKCPECERDQQGDFISAAQQEEPASKRLKHAKEED